MWNWKNWAPAAVLGMTFGLASVTVQAAEGAVAPVQISGAWARASVQGQQATGAFMQLTAQEDLRLIGVETPVAAQGEVHEMRMEGDVMRMRQIEGLDLPKGKTVVLKPGSYHLMFQQLKAPLQDGSQVPVKLLFQDAKGAASSVELQVPVKRMAPPAGHAMPAGHAHGH